jgi:starvation-inducible DNA-binding protein
VTEFLIYDGIFKNYDWIAIICTIIKYIREHISKVEDDFKDLGTADFLTGLMQEHEEMAWILRATIAKA